MLSPLDCKLLQASGSKVCVHLMTVSLACVSLSLTQSIGHFSSWGVSDYAFIFVVPTVTWEVGQICISSIQEEMESHRG